MDKLETLKEETLKNYKWMWTKLTSNKIKPISYSSVLSNIKLLNIISYFFLGLLIFSYAKKDTLNSIKNLMVFLSLKISNLVIYYKYQSYKSYMSSDESKYIPINSSHNERRLNK